MPNNQAVELKYLLELRKAASQVMHRAAEILGDIPQIYTLVTSGAAHALRVERVGIWLFDTGRTSLEAAALFSLSTQSHSRPDRIPRSACPRYMDAISSDQLVVVDDACSDVVTSELADTYLKPLGIVSMLDAPIVLRGETIGVLCCEHCGIPRHWQIGELAFVEQMADFIALSIESAERSKLEQLTVRLASIIGATEDLVATVDATGKPFYVNPAGRLMLGLAPQQVIEQLNVRDVYDDAQWQKREREVLPHALAHGSWSGETVLRTLNGELIPVWQSLIVHRDDAGQVQFISTINRDLRAQKKIERELQFANQDLERRVRERTEQLESMNQNLETFAFSVSHDLKAPLRGIEGYSRLLLEDYRAQLPEEAQWFIDNIRSATVSMNQLIDDLLTYSRVGRRELTRTRFSLRQVLTRVLDGFGHDTQSGKVCIVDRTEDVEMNTDIDCLRQIVRNLVDNGVKFSARAASPRVEISTQKNPHSLVLCIKDNGCGFDMKYHDRIFSIFQRLHSSDSNYPGTGVGLAIVAKAAERLRGRVWARSEPGVGSEFFLELPYES